ncbi:unnamed protein product [Arabidopsis thaliana]|uniref:(thale cress) hypothetical protein n=1 Tax=Arabidopsis thaliana TaxID=3702 RepID=A0A178V3I8_ARATH|nr:hypothetical protein AXX17_AT4G22160 [Arabidopsis thaliana]CAD5328381.1 unnamed protein product [Arabidopsis thaliana]
MADGVRNDIFNVLARFDNNLIKNLRSHLGELEAIRVLLENIMNDLNANELLNPVDDPVVIDDHDEMQGFNSDED